MLRAVSLCPDKDVTGYNRKDTEEDLERTIKLFCGLDEDDDEGNYKKRSEKIHKYLKMMLDHSPARKNPAEILEEMGKEKD